ncbi:MAG TPA: Smr/MutS family protein [Verrucomicrobiota bacterium]|nr:Smr/MutS family protein [Verrucomicrobiota bacterium]
MNLESGRPSVDQARRRLLREMDAARRARVRVLKVIHGWGSSGEGGKLGPAIRRSLRLRVREGKARLVIPGDRFSSDTAEGRELLSRHPALRSDPDLNRANPGITIVEIGHESKQEP